METESEVKQDGIVKVEVKNFTSLFSSMPFMTNAFLDYISIEITIFINISTIRIYLRALFKKNFCLIQIIV